MVKIHSRNLIKRLSKWFPTLLGILTAVGMVVFIIRKDILASIDLHAIQWDFAIMLLFSRCGTWFLNGLSLAVFVKEDEITLDFVETFGLTIASLFINKVTPVAGAMVVKSGYLKGRYQYPISKYLALMVSNTLMNYFVSGLLGMIVIGMISIIPGFRLAWEGIPIMTAVLVLPVIILILPWQRLSLPDTNRILRWASLAVKGWNQIRNNKKLLTKQFLIVIAIIFSQSVSFLLAPLSLGKDSPALGMVFISILTNVTRVTPIRDIFGFTELVSGLGTQMTGIGIEIGVTAAIMIRVTSIAGNLIFGPLFIFLLSKRLGRPLFKSIRNNKDSI